MVRVIFADDEVETRDNIVACINWEKNGIDIVGTADNGEQALKLILEKKPDIAIIDIYMPILNGLEVIEQARETLDVPPVFIIVSGYDDFSYAQKAIRLNVEEYLLKPFRPNDLLDAVRKAVWHMDFHKDSENDDFFTFIRNCNDESNITSKLDTHYSIQDERKVLSSIAVGTEDEVIEAVTSFCDHCIEDQQPASALINAQMLCVEIKRMIIERNKDINLTNLFIKRTWTYANMHAQLKDTLMEAAFAAYDYLDTAKNKSSVIMDAVQYIEKNYAKDLTLSEVASHIYVSPSYLSYLFKQKMNINFMAYIHEVRMEKAKKLLMNAQFSVREIANMVGYNCEKHFLQKFKSMYNMTPSQFRFKKSE